MSTFQPTGPPDPDPGDDDREVPGELALPEAAFLSGPSASRDDTVDDQEGLVATVVSPPAAPGAAGHEVALWAGVAAGCGSLLAIGIFDVLNPDQWQEYLGAIVVALITAGAVYAKQRLDDAKHAGGPAPPTGP